MKAKVRLGKKELFRFLFYHMYFRPVGLIYLIVGVLSMGGGIYYLILQNTSGIFLILISLVYFVLQPILLWGKAANQAKNPIFASDTYYEFSETGIKVWQEGVEPSELQWQNVWRVVKAAKDYYIYVDAAHGNIIPKESFQFDTSSLDEIVKRNVPKNVRRGFGK